MSFKEVKELRQAGKLEEAVTLARSELRQKMESFTPMEGLSVEELNAHLMSSEHTLWERRALAWVLYDYLKKYVAENNPDEFIKTLKEISTLQLSPEEKMFWDQIPFQLGKMGFVLMKDQEHFLRKLLAGPNLFSIAKDLPFTKPSEGYSFLFKGFHKMLKDHPIYTEFIEWWDLSNFRMEDYQKEKLPNGKEIMSIAEQAFIANARHLISENDPGKKPDPEKINAFLPRLDQLIEQHPEMQYPPYYKGKLLLYLGDREKTLSALIPFARKKKNDFWVWEILGDAFMPDEAKQFACYCKALSLQSPEEMLIGLRQRMAKLFLKRDLLDAAKTEIVKLLEVRSEKGFKIPNEVGEWVFQDWYGKAIPGNDNRKYYEQFTAEAEALLFADVNQEQIIVEFVNSEKKILNFIASEEKHGFMKYDRFLKEVRVGDVLLVRFQSGVPGELYKAFTMEKNDDPAFRSRFMKRVSGLVKIPDGKEYGFLDDVFISPAVIKSKKLSNGGSYVGDAIKSYNAEKKKWGWKLL